MGVMSVRIDDRKRKMLKVLASIKGKSMGGILADLIDDYIEANKKDLPTEEAEYLLRLSEGSFNDWDNEEDEVYNDL